MGVMRKNSGSQQSGINREMLGRELGSHVKLLSLRAVLGQGHGVDDGEGFEAIPGW